MISKEEIEKKINRVRATFETPQEKLAFDVGLRIAQELQPNSAWSDEDMIQAFAEGHCRFKPERSEFELEQEAETYLNQLKSK